MWSKPPLCLGSAIMHIFTRNNVRRVPKEQQIARLYNRLKWRALLAAVGLSLVSLACSKTLAYLGFGLGLLFIPIAMFFTPLDIDIPMVRHPSRMRQSNY